MKIISRAPGNHSELLEQFLATRDQRAFASLAAAHLGLIYSVALRITQAPDLAEDVAQTVLIKLAALRRLPGGVSLNAWLHRVSRSAAIDLVRAEERRRQRETVAAAFADGASAGDDSRWDRISPVIDEVIGQLPARDRELILSRFFTGSSHGSMARTLGMTEDAVRMRLKRAMEKMRVLLERRGIATSAALLALCLPAHAASPVPEILLERLPRIIPPPMHKFLWLRALFAARPLQTAALAASIVAAVAIGLPSQEPKAVAARTEVPTAEVPAALLAPVDGIAEPSQEPGFDRETASRFAVPPRNLRVTPPDDSEIEFPDPRIEVVFKYDLSAPDRFSA
ncbi:sigma-70 family RNA polymerase sigma factor [Haloferula sp. BvORR071]|uniref:RNA polymerase sigma factor n=1 Tax=Haloferula sp. BvORR071 TaxID=1396141 RepID=UPI0006970E1F|nr:sigma-70 family RNA polymerase sigma factor [Haloferula sp. BvORR071]